MSDAYNEQKGNPEPVTKFDSKRVKASIHEALERRFATWEYDPAQAQAKTREVSKFVFNQLQDTRTGTYSIAGQGVRIATRELWNPNTDNLISETYKGKNFVAVCLFWYCYIE